MALMSQAHRVCVAYLFASGCFRSARFRCTLFAAPGRPRAYTPAVHTTEQRTRPVWAEDSTSGGAAAGWSQSKAPARYAPNLVGLGSHRHSTLAGFMSPRRPNSSQKFSCIAFRQIFERYAVERKQRRCQCRKQ